jgi:hypothetical protein
MHKRGKKFKIHGKVMGLAVDASGNIYVGGYWCDYSPFPYKFYLTADKYNSAGELQWSGTWPALETEELDPHMLEATGVAVDGSGTRSKPLPWPKKSRSVCH